MQSINWLRQVSMSAVILGLMTASCVIQGRNPQISPSDSRSLTTEEPNAAAKAVAKTTYSALPLSFEANHGQSDAQVRFQARGNGYNVFLTPTEAIITLQPSGENQNPKKQRKRETQEGNTSRSAPHNPQLTVLRLQVVDANPYTTVSGVDELSGRVNYVVGQESTKWRTDIPTYAKVKYESVYPGVDLIYYGADQRQLEYDFHVAPGTDPSVIRLKFDGVETLDVDAAGDLVLHAAGRAIRQQRPHIYQEVGGVRQTITGGYILTGEREVAFYVGPYDASHPLTIDPVIAYSTYLGGNGHEWSSDKDAGNDIALDAAGNIYVVGTTNSLGRYDSDVFVRKFDPSGSQLLYETYLDSNGTDDAGYGIAVDTLGNAYVTGQFGSPFLPGSALGALVAKLDPAGVPLYQITFGANSPGFSLDSGADIAVDDVGNAYVVGTTYGLGTPFPTTPDAFQKTFRGLTDAFVVKLNPSGGFVYSTLLGGAGYDEGWSIAVRKVGAVYHAYVTGETALADDFPTTPGAFQTTFGGAADAFVAQLNAIGSALVYSTYLGGSQIDTSAAIALDSVGNAYLTGATGGNFPVINAFQPIYGGAGGATPAYANAFVAKLNPSGSALVYSSYMGGGGFGLFDYGSAIQVDGAGNAYLTGVTGTRQDLFTGAQFPIVNAFQPEPGGGAASYYSDAFVAKLTPQGTLVYSSYLGGSYWDEGHGIALDMLGNVYVTGITSSEDFPVTPNAFQPTIAQGCSYPFSCPDAFVTKIANNATNTTLTVTKVGTGSGTVTSTPAGISCGADCTENYANGTLVSLTAVPATGSTFAGWSGDADCTDGSVTMTVNTTCIATFNTLRYTLTVTKTGTGSGTVTSSPAGVNCGTDCSEIYNGGAVISLTAAPTTGSTFTGWSGDVDCVDGVVTANANKTCTARFDLITAKADLLVSALSGPNVSAAGATVVVTATIRNQGKGAAGDSTIKFYLSANTTFEAQDILLGSRAVPALAARANHTASTTLLIPANTSGGSYYILALADANGVVPETNETNNIKTKALSLGPDLIVSALAAPKRSSAGALITVTNTTKNQGSGVANASATQFYLSVDATFGAGDVFLGSRSVPPLTAGASNAVSTSLTIPPQTTPRNYFILAVSDANQVAPETNETNNVKSKAFTVQ